MVRKLGVSAGSRQVGRGGQRRSAFREEFYRDTRPANQPSGPAKRAASNRGSRRRRTMSVWLPTVGLLFMFCILAVAGSSAMIWLRKLGALFGVEWAGDG